MAVMAAGVHFSGYRTGPGQISSFMDRQRVHIGAQANSTRRVALAQAADDAGFTEAAGDLIAPLRQLAGDQFAGIKLFKT